MANNYSEEEKLEFRKKDRRIGLQGLVQTLITTFDKALTVKETVQLAHEYLAEIYQVVEEDFAEKKDTKEESTWVKIAKEYKLPIPNETQCKNLHSIYNLYYETTGKQVDPTKLLKGIISYHGKYPMNPDSVKIVVETIEAKLLVE